MAQRKRLRRPLALVIHSSGKTPALQHSRVHRANLANLTSKNRLSPTASLPATAVMLPCGKAPWETESGPIGCGSSVLQSRRHGKQKACQLVR